MKRKNIFFVASLILFGLLTIQSCQQEDPTTFVTESTNTIPEATSPIVASDGTVFFTGSTIDLSWTSDNKGAANKYTVYFGTTKSGSVFMSDLVDTKVTVPITDGNTYFWRVETIDANGIKTTSPVFSFIAIDGSNPKFTVSLVCKTDVLTSIGVDLKSDDVADLRFLILKKSDMSIVKVVDAGYANEVFRNFQDLPDGEYVLGVDVVSTLDAGDLNSPVNLSYSLNFFQKGVVNTTYDYPNVMTNEFTCSSYRTDLATVKKVGSQYTTERVVSKFVDHSSDTKFIGTWKGNDDAYPSEITASIVSGDLLFEGFNRGWMQDYWGEVIIEQFPVNLVLNYCQGTFTIPNQEVLNTTWKGDPQLPYSIEGSGSFDTSGDFTVMTIKYKIIQGGSSIFTSGNGVPLGYLEAKITLDPAGFAAIKQSIKTRRPNR